MDVHGQEAGPARLQQEQKVDDIHTEVAQGQDPGQQA